MNYIRIIAIIALCGIFMAYALPMPKKYVEYCEKYRLTAYIMQEMYGVPCSIQFAQAIIESGGGVSRIGQDANNHFGIRCGDHWKGDTHFTTSGCWRCYEAPADSYLDHAKFLNKYYNGACFKDYKAWANLQGYGGDGYWKEVIRVVERYKLYEYDK